MAIILPEALKVFEMPFQGWPKWKSILFTGSVSRVETNNVKHPGEPDPVIPVNNFSLTGTKEVARWPTPGPEHLGDDGFIGWGMSFSPLCMDGGLMTQGVGTPLVEDGGVTMQLIASMKPQLVPADRMRGRIDGRLLSLKPAVGGGSPSASLPEQDFYIEQHPASWATIIRSATAPSLVEINLEDLVGLSLDFVGSTQYLAVYTGDDPDELVGTHSIITNAALSVTFIS